MVTILCGDNSWGLQRRLHDLINSFVGEHGDLVLEQLAGDETTFEQLYGAVTSLPFLAAKKMVVVRNLSENSDLVSSIESILSLPDDTTELVIVEGALDKRKAYYKTLKAHKGFEEFVNLNGPALTSWLTSEAKNLGAQLKQGDAQYLIDRVGQDQALLHSELEKLWLYSPQVTRSTIDLLTEQTPESSIFDLLGSAFAGQKNRALELYEQQRLQRVEPFNILSMLTWQLHQIALAKTSSSNTAAELAREAGLSPYSAGKSLQLASSRSLHEISDTAAALTDLEYRTKTSSYDIDEALKTLIVSL